MQRSHNFWPKYFSQHKFLNSAWCYNSIWLWKFIYHEEIQGYYCCLKTEKKKTTLKTSKEHETIKPRARHYGEFVCEVWQSRAEWPTNISVHDAKTSFFPNDFGAIGQKFILNNLPNDLILYLKRSYLLLLLWLIFYPLKLLPNSIPFNVYQYKIWSTSVEIKRRTTGTGDVCSRCLRLVCDTRSRENNSCAVWEVVGFRCGVVTGKADKGGKWDLKRCMTVNKI